MSFTLADLEQCERQILEMRTSVQHGDKKVEYGALESQLRIRDMIRSDLAARGIGVVTENSRSRSWYSNLSKGV